MNGKSLGRLHAEFRARFERGPIDTAEIIQDDRRESIRADLADERDRERESRLERMDKREQGR